MKTEIIYQHIDQRMRELGIVNYTKVPYSFQIANNSTAILDAEGTYFFTCWWSRNTYPAGGSIIIESDSSYQQGNYEAWQQSSDVEHTGQIEISVNGFATDSVTIEFIRVICG